MYTCTGVPGTVICKPLDQTGFNTQRQVITNIKILKMAKNIGIYDVQCINQHGSNDGIIPVPPVRIAVPLQIFRSHPPVIPGRTGHSMVVHSFVTVVLQSVVLPKIPAGYKSAINNRKLPIISVINLPQPGKKGRVQGSTRREQGLCVFVLYYTV